MNCVAETSVIGQAVGLARGGIPVTPAIITTSPVERPWFAEVVIRMRPPAFATAVIAVPTTVLGAIVRLAVFE